MCNFYSIKAIHASTDFLYDYQYTFCWSNSVLVNLNWYCLECLNVTGKQIKLNDETWRLEIFKYMYSFVADKKYRQKRTKQTSCC
jgi:hypothetical protein